MLMRQQTRVTLFQGKKIPRNMEQREIFPSEFRLFCGTEKARNSVRTISQKKKLGTRNFVLNHSAEDKNAWNSVPYLPN